MHFTPYVAAALVCSALAGSIVAQSARAIRGASPLIAIENEPPAKLIVDPPLPEPLAMGRVFIQYTTRLTCEWRRGGGPTP